VFRRVTVINKSADSCTIGLQRETDKVSILAKRCSFKGYGETWLKVMPKWPTAVWGRYLSSDFYGLNAVLSLRRRDYDSIKEKVDYASIHGESISHRGRASGRSAITN
jgi:hypothetical protein